MANTPTALYQQNGAASVAAAFPQPPGNPNLDLDLLHIRGQGNSVLAVVNSAGSVSGGQTGTALTLTQAAVSTLTLTSAAVNSFVLTSVVGATATYIGTITGGDSNAFAGKTVVISGFSTGGNNVTAVILTSSATQFTVAVTTQADETHAAAALVVGVTQVTYAGTITGGTSSAFAGKTAIISGFAANTGANNITGTIVSSSATQIVLLATAASVAETHAGAAQISGVSQTTYTGTITGGGSNLLAGRTINVTGFSTSGNNVTGAVVVSSNTTTLVVTTTTQANETHAGVATLGSPSYVVGGTRIGTFFSRLAPTATLAQIFADAFSNSSQQDIIQVINVGGNVSYYLNYQGVATGS